ncbi:conserved hypothetical protein [Gammaproteobacteria bacterium]
MPRQSDLFEPTAFSLKPEVGRTEPRLWVRRLGIWADANSPPLREIVLRPGFNIIWSPDSSDQEDGGNQSGGSLGHGSGKTLFCRLLRYVLGENHFAPDEQRDHIINAFPEGRVGAEIIIDGMPWAVLRPFAPSRRHFAIAERNLEQLLAENSEPTGIEPLLHALETCILSPEVAALIPTEHPRQAWLVALAWLSRDQECRFDKPLDWRSSDSDSGSPVRGQSVEWMLDAVRALIGAIDPQEFQLRMEIEPLKNQRDEATKEIEHRRWEATRLQKKLVTELQLTTRELPPGRLVIELLRTEAKSKLAQAAQVSPNLDVSNLDFLRQQAMQAHSKIERLKQELSSIDAALPLLEKFVNRIKGEMGAASTKWDEATNLVCPICAVPIDRALAEGCRLSHRLPDPEQAKQRMEKLRQELGREEQHLREARLEQKRLNHELLLAQAPDDEARLRLQAVEQLQIERNEVWFKAKRLRDDIERLDLLLAERQQQHHALETLTEKIETLRGRAAAFRDGRANVFQQLSLLFDVIIRALVGKNASGKVVVDGRGLRAVVELGGERTTAAIDSLKVIAFDLAALCMGMEGKTRLPPFLIHDSPREADLGIGIYHRLFHLAVDLERSSGRQPLFQYIITTTTAPPETFKNKEQPWLREKLRGAPSNERLMRRDL